MEMMKSKLHPMTIAKSSLFQQLLLRYLWNPTMRTLNRRSRLIRMFKKSSTVMKVGDSAILKPSIIVVRMSKQPISNRPI